jgi:hypothetical protein
MNQRANGAPVRTVWYAEKVGCWGRRVGGKSAASGLVLNEVATDQMNGTNISIAMTINGI